MTIDWEPRAQALAAGLTPAGGLDLEWRRAFAETPRQVFVPSFIDDTAEGGCATVDGGDVGQRERWLGLVYSNASLVTQVRPAAADGTGAQRPTSSSSMPSIMAWMLQALGVRAGDRVLEIGTGTGYNTALLAHRLGAPNVVTIDIDPDLVELARERLHGVGYEPTLVAGDGAAGVPAGVPYDAIIATAAVDHIPRAWIEQLRPGGTIVTDLRGGFSGAIAVLQKIDEHTVEGRCHTLDAAFMPMRQDVRYPLRHGPAAPLIIDRRNPAQGTTATEVGLVAEVRALRFLIELQLGAIAPDLFIGEDEVVIGCADGSWATASIVAGADGEHAVQQGGPRRLWDSVEAAVALWRRAGRPSIDAFGVTASTDKGEQRVWLHAPDSGISWPLAG